MATFSNGESGASVRAKINAAIGVVDSLGSGDNLLMTSAQSAKLGNVPSDTNTALSAKADQSWVEEQIGDVSEALGLIIAELAT